MNLIKKNNFTLLEVIISLFLITIIITFLFGFFSKIMNLEKNIEEKKTKILAINHAQVRLTQVFSNVYQSAFITKSPFFTKNSQNSKGLILYITYDNKIDSDPNFSLIVKAKLFVNDINELCLETYSRDENQGPRTETLLKGVKRIKYKFLSNSDSKLKKYKSKKSLKNICWFNFWPKKAEILPSAIKIKITKNEYSLDFAFFLPVRHVNI
ncbi:MAG: hypothetical protein KR126chlam5_00568 [Candidatus Anoxychlamydiales bacterium]|nr:hypothetical protein [Candidatus Anoxychlamydiales bacterium]